MPKKIFLVVGTRPDFIKMIPLYRELIGVADFDVKLVSTGQHRDLMQQVAEVFSIAPHYDLQVMREGQNLASLTAKILLGMSDLLQDKKPDLVLVHGDTTTCFASALACFYQQIPIAHIEAGLRSFRLDAPFPEEFNRQSITPWVWMHFAPDTRSRDNLIRGGVNSRKVVITGNTGVDAVREVLQKAQTTRYVQPPVLITLHRRENGDGTLSGILNAIKFAAARFPQIPFVFPLHPNPLVQTVARAAFAESANIQLVAALPYDEFISVLAQSRLVITDSGSLQEEATLLQRPVLLLRNVSERVDGLRDGYAKIVGTNPCTVASAIVEALTVDRHCPVVTAASLAKQSPAKMIADVIKDKLLSFAGV